MKPSATEVLQTSLIPLQPLTTLHAAATAAVLPVSVLGAAHQVGYSTPDWSWLRCQGSSTCHLN